jgi:ABC-type branched-subunit amino acid transport system substrate-binding protein
VGAGSKKAHRVTMAVLALVATGTVACSSTPPSTTAAGDGSAGPRIPAGAFSDHTGITAGSVRIANVSTLALGGLFKGALVGTQAYADYANSTGGVRGRTITVDSGDDGFSGAGNAAASQNAIANDFALVGGFSLQDGAGGALLGQDPGMPDVSVVLDAATNALPNVYSPVPLGGGWETGPLRYLKEKYPEDVGAVGTLTAGLPSALTEWAAERRAMEQVGFRVIYDPAVSATQTDFTANVAAMKRAGVKLLVVDQLPPTDAAALLGDLRQQHFQPQVVLGAAAYSNSLIAEAGGPVAVNGALVVQNASLYLGQDAPALPAVGLFDRWVAVAAPGFHADLFTLYGWLSAELFADALGHAGPDPSRGSLLRALSTMTAFSGHGIVTTSDPAAKTAGHCYLLGQVTNGQYRRLDDPPVSAGAHGYRCDGTSLNPAH